MKAKLTKAELERLANYGFLEGGGVKLTPKELVDRDRLKAKAAR